ncbi:MAG TPA: hypothetical protein PKE30_14870, partial [Niabella sp.]|nr:hypothetical protein [Niabella sp.]
YYRPSANEVIKTLQGSDLFEKSSDYLQVAELVQTLQEAHFRDIEIKRITPGIEDCFINLMKAPPDLSKGEAKHGRQ